jgi:hypothetical protein
MGSEWAPPFTSYADLRRGILNERGYAQWCRWVAERLEVNTGGSGD